MSLKLLERQQKKREEQQQQQYGNRPVYSANLSAPPPAQRGGPKIDSYGREIPSPQQAPPPSPFSHKQQPPYSTYDRPPSSSSRPPSSSYQPRPFAPSYDSQQPLPSRSSSYEPSRPYDAATPSQHRGDAYRERAPSARSNTTSEYRPQSLPPRDEPSSSSLAAWSRPALESRVTTLERLLAESTSATASTVSRLAPASDRELSDHLTVTVRKNRELRAELETCKSQINTLLAERETLFKKLNSDNDALQHLLEETQRGKDALSQCISQLSVEKVELKRQLEQALEEAERLRSSGNVVQAPILYEELHSHVDEVSLINEGLRESMRMMKLKEDNEESMLQQPQMNTTMFDDE